MNVSVAVRSVAELCSSRLYGIVFVFCLFAFVGDK